MNRVSTFPQESQLRRLLARRKRIGWLWQVVFLLATILVVLSLIVLLYNIVVGAFGYVIVQDKVSPQEIVQTYTDTPEAALHTLSADQYRFILEQNLSKGLLRRLNSEAPLTERSREELYRLVVERVVKPRVVQSYSLVDSIFERDKIFAEAAALPHSRVEFRRWLNLDFLTGKQASVPELAGVRTALLGSLWVIAITVVVALPLGVAAAIYLEEYAAVVANPWLRRLNAVIQTNINNLAGVPSIIYGILGLAIFVRGLEAFTSGAAFGATADGATANGRTIMSAGLTLALLILPIIIINAQEAIRAVPQSLRQASMGLGATRWQTIWHHVLPSALPGILTGTILSVSRALGETAPLVVVGASTFITIDPDGPFSKFTTLTIQIYQWTARPQDEFRNIAAAAIIVLLVLLLTLNAAAILLRNRYSRRLV
ncbi:MAG: phosphate ABC transporter permease PstA [Chloroflexi bacterium]|nr:MAG: phosphate ABC transporter permease PstA [Chloroflexota bacterium]